LGVIVVLIRLRIVLGKGELLYERECILQVILGSCSYVQMLDKHTPKRYYSRTHV